MSAGRRIVLLIGEMAVGGAERVVATLANAWSAHGSQVWLVPTFLGSRTLGYDLRPDVKVAFLADRVPLRTFSRWTMPYRKARALRALVEEIGPDVVVSFLTNVNILAICALANLRVPIVISERTDPAAGRELHWLLHALRSVLYQFADALVVQTSSAASGYRKRILRAPPVRVIANPLPGQLEYAELRAAHAERGGTVVAMGRLTESKGFDILLQSFAKEFADLPEWRLVIWGEGPLRDRLLSLIVQTGLRGRAELRGITTEPWKALASGQLFALPSAYEGFPNAMLEAMAVGLPCVAFDCPSGPRDLSSDGAAAVIVPLGDGASLGRELRRLALDPAARAVLGTRAAGHVRAAYSESQVLSNWDSALDSALGHGTSARHKDA